MLSIAAVIINILEKAGADHTPVAETPYLHLDEPAAGIPYCDFNADRASRHRLLFITTLDGRLSAIDGSRAGILHWSIPTGPGPLISSTIHRLELTNNGQFVRMIPSLSGCIYKFDGESIDATRITTERLLSSSAKFSDDLVISGGKETRTYGVSVRTGLLLYECSMHGCVNSTESRKDLHFGDRIRIETKTDHDALLDDIIVIRRHTQTVRAVESRTGEERWNFSVGQHELNLKKSAECHDSSYSDMNIAMLDLEIRVVIPEGLICAFSKSNPKTMLWKFKFDYPIVSGWKIGADDQLEAIDMFTSAQWMWDHDYDIFDPPIRSMSPAIYLGMHHKQLYIQESANLQHEIGDQFNIYSHLMADSVMPIIPWRPIPASSNSLALIDTDKVITNDGGKEYIYSTTKLPKRYDDVHELVPYDEHKWALSAQSVLNASGYVNGNGFYLYSREDLKNEENLHCETEEQLCLENSSGSDSVNESENHTNRSVSDDLDFSLDNIDAPTKVVVLSLWFWWKEVVVIALTTAVLVNIFLGQRQRQKVLVIERHVPVPTAYEATEQSTVALLGPATVALNANENGCVSANRSLSESTSCSGDHFNSRFLSDFDLVRCLGCGGFGVVFEAKNKLDDCKYAVKRITLPNKKESRDRVMREVKTLANCEHQNIVRYFQAWVETPPPGWQEEEDSKWLAHEMSMSIRTETPDGTTLPSFGNAPAGSSKCQLHVERKRQLSSWITNNNCIREGDVSNIVLATKSKALSLKGKYEMDIYRDNNNSHRKSAKKETESEKRQYANSISIDINSDSNDSSLGRNIDYSELSDSFQIEFVRTTRCDGTKDIDCDYPTYGCVWTSNDIERSFIAHNHIANFKTEQRPRSLDHEKVAINIDSKESCKALMPLTALNQSAPKIQQNKVYLYIQMQLCRKESLRDWLRENDCDTRQSEIASIFYQIVDAVDYVHLKGLIHRDLKPSNIFFSQNGQIKVGDFGLVTDMSDIPNMVTKCGDDSGLPSCALHTQQVGTHLYMSPEQLRGQPYDFKVDIYSLGLIFFELLVFFATEMERIKTLRNLRDGDYPIEFSKNFPKEHVLLRMMLSKRPTDRPATPELKIRLHDILKWPDCTASDSDRMTMVAVTSDQSRSPTLNSSDRCRV
ncbi:eukaryotic translation initiation factor 2-alpha kinase isoform X2 [Eurosta solidaginis]|uniref:eukaryotic translation initiation factor 2-alpha kinase isoform X2 n=1 Tax=Eurosta solidaginis TaxID=178769 RepID=UPI0035316F25